MMVHARIIRRLMVLAAIALIVGAGFCLFDSDQAAADVCLVVATTVAAPPLPVLLASIDRPVPARVTHNDLASFDPLAPPPRA